MDKIEKLFRRINQKERTMLRKAITALVSGNHTGLNIKKIKSSDYYRLRVGNFRVIFHTEGMDIVIDDVRLKDDNTYKNLD